MSKTTKKHRPTRARHSGEKVQRDSLAHPTEKRFNIAQLRHRIESFSRTLLHDYAIPFTRAIETRLHRLEQSL